MSKQVIIQEIAGHIEEITKILRKLADATISTKKRVKILEDKLRELELKDSIIK